MKDNLELRLRRLGVALQSPILVRELRAMLRGRKFFVSHMLLLSVLAGVLLIAATVNLGEGRSDPAALGKLLYWAFAGGFSVVIIFLVPAFSCTSITMEREARTIDLLLTTTIRPWEVVWGKLLSALVVILLFMSSALPLVTICFLFGGISPWDLAVLYLAVLFGTVVVSSVSLSVSAHCQESKSSVVISYVLTLIVVVALAVAGGIFYNHVSRGLGGGALSAVISGLHWSEQLLIVIGPQLLGLAVFAWNFAAATNRLKPATSNRSTGLRAIWLVSLLAGVGFWFWLIGVETGVSPPGLGPAEVFPAAMSSMCVASLLVWAGALYFASEEAVQPPRVVEDTRRLSGLLLPLRVFMPGPLTGMFLTALGCAAVLGCTMLVNLWLPANEPDLLLLGLAVLAPMAAFILANAGLAALFSGLGFSRRSAGIGAFGAGVVAAAGPLVVYAVSSIAGHPEPSLWNFYYFSPVLSTWVNWDSTGIDLGSWVGVRMPGGGAVPVPLVTTALYLLLAAALWPLAALAVRRARRRWREHLAAAAQTTEGAPQPQPEAPSPPPPGGK